MTRFHTDWTAGEMRSLTDDELRQWWRKARSSELHSDMSGMGRSKKGRRMWRLNRELVEQEAKKRGLDL